MRLHRKREMIVEKTSLQSRTAAQICMLRWLLQQLLQLS